MSHEARLKALAIDLPPVPVAAGLYAPCVRSGNQLFVSGQVPVKDGVPMRKGKLGDALERLRAAFLELHEYRLYEAWSALDSRMRLDSMVKH